MKKRDIILKTCISVAVIVVISVIALFVHSILTKEESPESSWYPPHKLNIEVIKIDDNIITGVVQDDNNTSYKKGTTVNVSYSDDAIYRDKILLEERDLLYIYYYKRDLETGIIYYDSGKEYVK